MGTVFGYMFVCRSLLLLEVGTCDFAFVIEVLAYLK